MPCYDDRNSPVYIYQNDIAPLERKVAKLEAALCSILSYYDGPWKQEFKGKGVPNLLSKLDYEEAGISREWIEQWWVSHQEEDRKRKDKELKSLAKQKAKINALNKLTAEERKLLGIR